LAELLELPESATQGIRNIAQIGVLLCASNQAVFFFKANVTSDGKPAQKLNYTLAEQTRYGDDFHALCSPLLGSGTPANYLERLFYLGLVKDEVEPTANGLAESAWKLMEPAGHRMQRDGAALQSREENLAELLKKAEEFLIDKLPIWRLLKVL
jgi:hypothetical protein